jgi:hypothetical protein
MKINCSICEAQFVSLVIDNEIALNEVSNKLTKHLETKHPAEFRNMKNTILSVVNVLPWFMQMTHFAKWSDEEETFLEAEYEKLWETISRATGNEYLFDDGDEVDEEDEEIDKSGNSTAPSEARGKSD